MKSVVVVGAQWGDEGKGKVVDYLAGSFDYILLLDVIEHLRSPEQFLDSLRASRVGESLSRGTP